eukprot:TRINITY_DN5354_c0_g2_i1.p3 TRINITY_DN5354_c0_g2~~TRINITY_DN5354_c0_g2_i1.p3  ORF type:complete len:102 (+),score=43.02 TRINITY_DN5354_c0_g2_i1:691-996(+)
MELKIKKDEYVEELERSKKEDWDKYTKGPESQHIKGMELKTLIDPAPDYICQFSSKVMKPVSPPKSNVLAKEETLKTMSDKNKVAFILLRELYNSLDQVNF